MRPESAGGCRSRRPWRRRHGRLRRCAHRRYGHRLCHPGRRSGETPIDRLAGHRVPVIRSKISSWTRWAASTGASLYSAGSRVATEKNSRQQCHAVADAGAVFSATACITDCAGPLCGPKSTRPARSTLVSRNTSTAIDSAPLPRAPRRRATGARQPRPWAARPAGGRL